MDKTKQRELLSWLKQQSAPIRRYLRLLMLLGIVSALLIALQAWLMATLLQGVIIEQVPRDKMSSLFIWLILTVLAKAIIVWVREQLGFRCGMQVRQVIRRQLLERLQQSGPAWIKGKPTGSWATLLVEQIEQMHDYYARYLPQM
ncbi:MAG: ABC transporter transmembrane domain-containing protein, partial [Enterobacteriaceae bacterium]